MLIDEELSVTVEVDCFLMSHALQGYAGNIFPGLR